MPFWAACRERQLIFQICAACGTPRHPPGPGCPACGSVEARWQEPRGTARLWSWTVTSGPEPFVIALVVFDDMPGVRLITNVLDIEPDDVRVGRALDLTWQVHQEAGFLPRFRPRSEVLLGGGEETESLPARS
jgi:uncharacterized OB-fold protein